MWYTVKVLRIMYNLFAGTETLSLSVYEQCKFCLGDPPQFGGRGEARGQVWHLVKAHHGGHNLSIETETLSLSAYEPIAMQIFAWGTIPKFG